MKICLIGNTNNYPLILAGALRALGVDVQLMVTQKAPLHRPENMYPEMSAGYPNWIIDISDISEEGYALGGLKVAEVAKRAATADGVVLNYLGPSLSMLIGRPSIVLLTGSDLDYYANYYTVEERTRLWSKQYVETVDAIKYKRRWRELIDRQRAGIRTAVAVSYFPRGLIPGGDRLLDEIGVSDGQRFHIYMGDIDAIPQIAPPPARVRPRIFCGARLTWKMPIPPGGSELDYKGIDILLRGLHRYLRQGGTDVELRLVEKGLHVRETRELVAKLGLDPHVIWMAEMPRHLFLEELNAADICVDSLGSSMVGMSGLDAMATGRPLIANARPEVFASMLPEPSPICQAASPEEVATQLTKLVASPLLRETIGRQGHDFVARHWSPRAAALECLARLGLVSRTASSEPEE